MSQLSALEISVRHGTCSEPGCAICNKQPMGTVASYLNQIGFHVRNFSEDHKTGFGFVDVVEDEETCGHLLKRSGVSRTSRSHNTRPL